MAYATLDDVRGKLPQVKLDAQSRPTEADAQGWLDSLEMSMDVMLKNLGYDTPLNSAVSPQSISIVKDMVACEIASQVIIAQCSGVRDPDDLGAGRLHACYAEKIKALIDPRHPFSLPDATTINLDTKLEGDVGGLGLDSSFLEEQTITRDQVF